MTTEQEAADPISTWIWGICLLIGWVVAFIAAFGIASTLLSWNILPGGFDTSLRWDLAVLNGTMGVLGLVTVLGVARAVFGALPSVVAWHLVVPVAGIAISIAEELILHRWAEVHLGQYDFDHMGSTAVLSWTTILVAVSAFATLVSPRGAALPPILGSWVAAAFACVITLMNVPGLRDGIEAESWPLAILIGLSAVYAVGCIGLGVWRLRRG